MSRDRLLLVSSLLFLSTACRGYGDGSQWAGTIDTLESGVVLVSNPATGMWDESTTWRLVEDLRIGSLEGEGPATFAQVIAIEADPSGRIYVLDRQIQELRVFDQHGDYVRTIGRQGEGPGEFTGANGLGWGPDGNLWVVDQRQGRYTVFDSLGSVLATYRAPNTSRGWTWGGAFTADAIYEPSHVMTDDDHRPALLQFDSLRGYVDTLSVPSYEPELYQYRTPERGGMMQVPFAPTMSSFVDYSGHYWVGISSAYRIYQSTLQNDTLRAVEREYEPVVVSTAERDQAIARAGEFMGGAKFDPSRIPDHKPAFDRFFVDDAGNLWVQLPTSSEWSGSRLDVFDPAGRYLGQLSVDAEIDRWVPAVVRDNTVYLVVTDEFDVQYVVRLRIERPGDTT